MTYNEFIEKCRKKPVPPKPRHEHHIVPKSVGGTDDKGNLIYLSFSDHWLAHYILARDNPTNDEYVKIFKTMGSWEYFLQRSYAHYYTVTHYSDEQKSKMSHKGEANPMFGSHRFGEEAPNYGRKFSEEWKKHISESKKGSPSPNKGVPMSEEQKIKISNTLKGKMSGTNNPMFGKSAVKGKHWKLVDGKHVYY